jgi:triphosphoribosyl-dephospho-CoA synthase
MEEIAVDVIEIIGAMAAKALIYEVLATPKPGLVDRNNAGAHRDMDLHTFLRSAKAIKPGFCEMAKIGYCWRENPAIIFSSLKQVGIFAEKAMLSATNGVNTHKGAIFSVGLVSAAAGYYHRHNGKFDAEAILSLCGDIANRPIANEFAQISSRAPQTNGERIYRQYGIQGIRGEAANGFRSVRTVSLPEFRRLRKRQVDLNLALVQTLLQLMARVDDTNVVARRGPEALRYVQCQAQDSLNLGGMFTVRGREKIIAMDFDFIAKNISPGGCADLLAVTLLLDLLGRSRCF